MSEIIRAVVIDDEPDCVQSLVEEIERHCEAVEVMEGCIGAKEGIKAIHTHKPDVVFLDIDMPVINGFELLELVPNRDFEVVFTTAYDKFALQAFKISALDYLLKPIDEEALKGAVEKVRNQRQNGNAPSKIDFLIQHLKDLENNAVKRIALPTFEGLDFIHLDNIIYCQSDGAYTHVYLNDKNKLFISKSLRYLEEILCDFNFFRVHNSFIVNLDYIHKYSRTDGGVLIMKNGDKVRVSRSKKDKLLSLF